MAETTKAYYAILGGDTVVETWAAGHLTEAKNRIARLASDFPGKTFSLAFVIGGARSEPLYQDYA